MPLRGQPPLELPDITRDRAIASIRRFATEELELDIGDLRAGTILDYMLAEIGPAIYNQGIADAIAFYQERAGDLAAVAHREEFTYWKPKERR